jgi:AraC family transcriptional regulator
MTPTIVHMDEIIIRGVAKTFTGATRHTIPDLWAEAVPTLLSMQGMVNDVMYGACIGMNTKVGDDYGFIYMVAVHVDSSAPAPENMTTVALETGAYAVYTFDDHISRFSEFIDAVWRDHFPASGLVRRPSPDFERYDERWIPETGMGPVDYFIPIEDPR